MQFCLLLCVSPAYAQVCVHVHVCKAQQRTCAGKKIFFIFCVLDKNVAFLSIAHTQLKGAESD
jgi:hypothetical protein